MTLHRFVVTVGAADVVGVLHLPDRLRWLAAHLAPTHVIPTHLIR